jgi:hypothetical protein
MRATNRFVADLLLGGIRLERLECELHEVPNNEEELWTGRVRVPQDMLPLFELNRPYLLELEDGRQGRVVVHSISDSESNAEKLAEFQPATNKKLRSDRET